MPIDQGGCYFPMQKTKVDNFIIIIGIIHYCIQLPNPRFFYPLKLFQGSGKYEVCFILNGCKFLARIISGSAGRLQLFFDLIFPKDTVNLNLKWLPLFAYFVNPTLLIGILYQFLCHLCSENKSVHFQPFSSSSEAVVA